MVGIFVSWQFMALVRLLSLLFLGTTMMVIIIIKAPKKTLMYYFPDHLVPERKCAASRFLSAFCRTVVDAINIITAANNDIIQFVSI